MITKEGSNLKRKTNTLSSMLSKHGELLLMAAIFGLSRLAYARVGVRFDISSLYGAWHHIDVSLLRSNLFESLVYLHSQPPLFNLFLGVVLKLSGEFYPMVFQGIFFVLGLTICLLLYIFGLDLGINKLLAFFAAIIFSLSPDAVLHENVLLYRLPVTLLVLCSAYFLYRGLRGRKPALFVAFFALAILMGIRPAYHLLLWLGVLGYLCFATRGESRKWVLLVSVVPILIGTSFYLKNVIIFKRFTTSTWLGMNLWKSTTAALDQEGLREELIAGGQLSELSRHYSFLPLEKYPEEYWRASHESCSASPVLCEVNKSRGGTNFNHISYIEISEELLKDDLFAIKRYPRLVLRRVALGISQYLSPAFTWHGVDNNRWPIENWTQAWGRFVYGRVAVPASRELPARFREAFPFLFGWHTENLIWGMGFYPVLIIWYIMGLAWGLRAAFRSVFGKARDKITPSTIVLGFAGLIVLYVALVNNTMDFSENMSFRFETDPLSVILFGHLFNTGIVKFREKLKLNQYAA
jgi:hypothetical protein